MWESIVVAVVTAIAVTAIAESVRAVRSRLDQRNRVATWSIRALPVIPRVDSRFYLIENTGDADALDVHATVTGDAKFEVNAGVELDVLRPGDTFLMLMHEMGDGSLRIFWKDRNGKDRGPARRALTPFS